MKPFRLLQVRIENALAKRFRMHCLERETSVQAELERLVTEVVQNGEFASVDSDDASRIDLKASGDL